MAQTFKYNSGQSYQIPDVGEAFTDTNGINYLRTGDTSIQSLARGVTPKSIPTGLSSYNMGDVLQGIGSQYNIDSNKISTSTSNANLFDNYKAPTPSNAVIDKTFAAQGGAPTLANGQPASLVNPNSPNPALINQGINPNIPPTPTDPSITANALTIAGVPQVLTADQLNAIAKQSGFSGGSFGSTGLESPQDIAKRSQAIFDQNKDKQAPQDSAGARDLHAQTGSDLPQGTGGTGITNPDGSTYTPTPQFFGQVAPTIASFLQQATAAIQQMANHQTLQQQFAPALSGISGIDSQLVNMQNIMNGTQQDIMDEVTKAGGTITQSQLENLTVARNKNLMLKYQSLTNLRQSKVDEINMQVGLSEQDRSYAMQILDKNLNLGQSMIALNTQMQNAATDRYQSIIKNGGGYTALANALPDDQKHYAEQVLGIGQGKLSDPAWLAQADKYNSAKIQLEQAKASVEQAKSIQAQSGQTAASAQSLIESRKAQTMARKAAAIKSAISVNFPTSQVNPINLYAGGSQWVGKLEESYKVSTDKNTTAKGPSDLELIDAAVKINNGGQQITEAQVNLLLSGMSIQSKASVVGGKLVGIGAILDDNNRKTIKTLAENNLKRQKVLADIGTKQINDRLLGLGFSQNELLKDPLDAAVYINISTNGSFNSAPVTSDTGNTYNLPY